MSDSISVVIAEDSVLLRDGITQLLTRSGFEVRAACPDAETLMDAVREHVPDLVLVDVRMPPTFTAEGIHAALAIQNEFPNTAIVVLSQYVEEHYAGQLLTRERGIGYLLKDRVADTKQFVQALRDVADGGTALDHEVVAQILTRASANNPLHTLTPRERDVLELMAQGKTNAGISAELYISESSTEKHVTSIFNKLGLSPEDHSHRRVRAVLAWLQRK